MGKTDELVKWEKRSLAFTEKFMPELMQIKLIVEAMNSRQRQHLSMTLIQLDKLLEGNFKQ